MSPKMLLWKNWFVAVNNILSVNNTVRQKIILALAIVLALASCNTRENSNEDFTRAAMHPLSSKNGELIAMAHATGTAGEVMINWSEFTGADSYTIYWGTSSETTKNKISGINSPAYVQTGLTDNTTYYYQVAAVSDSEEIAVSSGFWVEPFTAGSVEIGGYHHVPYCEVCHDMTEYDNLKFIRKQMQTPNSGIKTVVFTSLTGTDSYADGVVTADDATFGPCEACHTLNNHHNNSATNDLTLTDGGDTSDHFAGQKCTTCHKHSKQFAPPHAQSHETHMHSPRAPAGMACSNCHDTSGFIDITTVFMNEDLSTANLTATTACDTCHSPTGNYPEANGLADAAIGAKANFVTGGVYDIDGSTVNLKVGKEKWCATCHDEAPSVISGISAPNVIGDEDAVTNYGTGYGFYKTGHGLETGSFPTTKGPAPNQQCLDCHDASMTHIDGEHRTYKVASSNYQTGYRLADIGGYAPMNIPRLNSNIAETNFALCFKCHRSSLYLVETNYLTNFRDDGAGKNDHYRHLSNGSADQWDSDWDGAVGDSYISCPACHNVHGSQTPAMTRHGELISSPPAFDDKIPALDFQYTPDDFSYPTLFDSTGGILLSGTSGGTSITTTKVCGGCHSLPATVYSRTPNDIYPPKISFVYGEVGSAILNVNFSEGVFNSPSGGALETTDFYLTDTDNLRAISSIVHIAGSSTADLTVSLALDNTDDIGFDTLAAATSSSIYDADGNTMNLTASIIQGDATPPEVFNFNPVSDAIDIPVNSDLTFTLYDAGTGIDWSSFTIHVTGDSGYNQTWDDTSTIVSYDSREPSQYDVTLSPDVFFGDSEVITGDVSVSDMVGNILSSATWSFTTTTAANWYTPERIIDTYIFGTPGSLIDKSFTTGNTSPLPNGGTHWIIFKLDTLGDIYTIDKVRLYGNTSPIRTWKISTSADGYTYSTQKSWSVGGSYDWYEYTLPASETARYVEVYTTSGPLAANTVFEFQFYGTPFSNLNNAPSLSWTGEANYTTDGVDPDSAVFGSTFNFRVSYTDIDNTAPAITQVWIDLDNNDIYDDTTEKFNMTETDVGDTTYTDGKFYNYSTTALTTAGSIKYRFLATDGTDIATGTPASDSTVTVTP